MVTQKDGWETQLGKAKKILESQEKKERIKKAFKNTAEQAKKLVENQKKYGSIEKMKLEQKENEDLIYNKLMKSIENKPAAGTPKNIEKTEGLAKVKLSDGKEIFLNIGDTFYLNNKKYEIYGSRVAKKSNTLLLRAKTAEGKEVEISEKELNDFRFFDKEEKGKDRWKDVSFPVSSERLKELVLQKRDKNKSKSTKKPIKVEKISKSKKEQNLTQKPEAKSEKIQSVPEEIKKIEKEAFYKYLIDLNDKELEEAIGTGSENKVEKVEEKLYQKFKREGFKKIEDQQGAEENTVRQESKTKKYYQEKINRIEEEKGGGINEKRIKEIQTEISGLMKDKPSQDLEETDRMKAFFEYMKNNSKNPEFKELIEAIKNGQENKISEIQGKLYEEFRSKK